MVPYRSGAHRNPMTLLAMAASLAVILLVLVDAFEAIVLPRRPTRRYRFSRFFYVTMWRVWAAVGKRVGSAKRRDAYLSGFGPMSLLLLLVVWAVGLISAFGLLQWSLGSSIATPGEPPQLLTDLYFSGTTFFTLGYGDVVPRSAAARVIAVTEAGMGFGFLAVVIGYLPVIYSAFSRRETAITLLDARAGSPPSAVELLRRYSKRGALASLDVFLAEWERWSAELLESHLSYPVLSYYRSQHDNQSWLASMTAVLDACALVISGIVDAPSWQASLTFAITRHAVVDLAQIFLAKPEPSAADRLPEATLLQAREMLAKAGAPVRWCDNSAARLQELRDLYEPYVNALGRRFLLSVPSWMPSERQVSNWQTSAWGRASRHAASTAEGSIDDVH